MEELVFEVSLEEWKGTEQRLMRHLECAAYPSYVKVSVQIY